MTFAQSEIGFAPGLFANRSRRASRGRWVDGNLIRFDNDVPAQIGGWQAAPVGGDTIVGRARSMHGWRPNDLAARYAAIGTHSNVYRFDGTTTVDITPDDIAVGRPDSTVGRGFGVGAFGAEEFGTPRTLLTTTYDATTWTFDMFGEVLIGCFTGDGTIYEYLASSDDEMSPVDNAPAANAICVSDERHVFAFGCDGNPNLVRFSDRENRAVWTPTASNRAGSYDMQATSQFQCGARVGGEVFAWTLTELFAFGPLANALVYSQRRVGNNCGVMGPHAVAVVTTAGGGSAYWMGRDAFFYYDGLVRELDCELQDYVFRDLNVVQRRKIVARTNAAYGECWFFYPSAASSEIDRAVIYNYRKGTWSKADLGRLAWLDAQVFPKPLAIDAAGTIYQHEIGTTANGAPMPSYIVSHPLTVGVGECFSEVSAFWPDLEPGGGACSLTVIARDYPGGPAMEFGPFPFTSAVEKIDLAISTRELQLRIAGAEGHWELGAPILTVQSGGMR